MRRLYRPLDDCHLLHAQSCQINFIGKCGNEIRQGVCGMILSAIEAAVNDLSNAIM
jgi:hypothetical protein